MNPNLNLSAEQFLWMQQQGAQQFLPLGPMLPAFLSMTPMQMQMLYNTVPAPQIPLMPHPPIYPFLSGFPAQLPGNALIVRREDPVFSVADEIILAHAIHKNNGNNLEEILLPLDGKNGHNTTEWIWYYVKNTKRIMQRVDDQVNALRNAEPSENRPAMVPSRSTQSTRQQIRRQQRHVTTTSRQSSSSQNPQAVPQSPPPQLRQQVNSRSPTPPTIVIRTPQGGNMFTDQDIKYLKEVLTRKLVADSSALHKLGPICAYIGERALHHSEDSWRKYLSSHPEILRDVRRKVRCDDYGSTDSDSGDDCDKLSVHDEESSAGPSARAKRTRENDDHTVGPQLAKRSRKDSTSHTRNRSRSFSPGY